jgi:hypothetical protein
VHRGPALRAFIGGGRPRNLESRSTTAGGLLPLEAPRTGKRLSAMPADYESSGRTRFAASTRGRGVE